MYAYIHSSIIHNNQKGEATPVSIIWWRDKQHVVSRYTMEYYSAQKRNEILIHPITWMNHEDIMLREINKPDIKRANTVWINFYDVLRVVRFIVTKSRMVVAKGREKGGNGELFFNGHEVQFGKMKKVLMMNVADSCKQWMYLQSLNCILKNG